MKLFAKIFFCSMLIFSIAFQVTGYLIISYSYENAILQEKKYAVNQYQYDKFIVQSNMYMHEELFDSEKPDKENLRTIADSMNTKAAFYGKDMQVLVSNLSFLPDKTRMENATDSTVSYQIKRDEHKSSILTYGKIEQSGKTLFLVIETDISLLVNNQKLMLTRFQTIYLTVMVLCLILVLLLSWLVTRPINLVSKAADKIAMGNYAERIMIPSKDEIGDLAANFNKMAEAIEIKMQQLSDNAKQKEDFVANFAHELKTPLTSVIGYADILYQTELTRNEVKDAAEYILNEGMRLEALSLKLMELLVLNRNDFVLEILPVTEVFDNIMQGMELICKKKNVLVHLNLEPEYIRIEFDLCKTLILNLLDNAIKAECRDIWIMGNRLQNSYLLTIEDNGIGIPRDEIGRITEAFYMVDKSRARKQHGAGLGLALADKIAAIHGTSLHFESDGKTGTSVTLEFICKGEQAYE